VVELVLQHVHLFVDLFGDVFLLSDGQLVASLCTVTKEVTYTDAGSGRRRQVAVNTQEERTVRDEVSHTVQTIPSAQPSI
jgi:hypothetical protein